MNTILSFWGGVLLCGLSLTAGPVLGDTQSQFQRFKQEHRERLDIFSARFFREYNAYKKTLRAKWGVAELSDSQRYIYYDPQKSAKVVANFEDNSIEVSLEASQGLTSAEVQQRISNVLDASLAVSVADAADSTLLSNSAVSLKNPAVKSTQQSVLAFLAPAADVDVKVLAAQARRLPAKAHAENLVDREIAALGKQLNKLGNMSTQLHGAKEQQYTEKMIASLQHEKNSLATARQQQIAALTSKNITSYKIVLQTDRMARALKFMPTVKENAQRWRVPKATILAVMETESSFNPLARSYVPAYGLMQIVPSTAGYDVNKTLFGVSKKPTAKQLYNSAENVNFGAAYFHLVMNRYLSGVSDPKSRLYCTVAAYNTGIGNLVKVFNRGILDRRAAIERINTMSPEQVYQVIKQQAHTETQRYLDKVLASREYFSSRVARL